MLAEMAELTRRADCDRRRLADVHYDLQVFKPRFHCASVQRSILFIRRAPHFPRTEAASKPPKRFKN
jgi:hypothetical protein